MLTTGVDVSAYQGKMDWPKAQAAGARFAYLRAGGAASYNGNLFVDEQLAANAAALSGLLPFGLYFYFRPQFSPNAQADFFAALYRDQPGSLPPVVDVESTGGLAPGQVSLTLQAFIERLFDRTNRWCLIYTRASFWNPYVAPNPLWPRLDLWLARYAFGLSSPWSDGNFRPRDWQTWKFWQFSADGNWRGPEFGARSPHIDLDRFNGSEADLLAYAGASQPLASVEVRLQQVEQQLAGVDSRLTSVEHRLLAPEQSAS